MIAANAVSSTGAFIRVSDRIGRLGVCFVRAERTRLTSRYSSTFESRGRMNDEPTLRGTLRRRDHRIEDVGSHGVHMPKEVPGMRNSERTFPVESRCGAVTVGLASLLPPLSVGGALRARPWLRFHIPLIEPDVRSYRIRLSDKTSRLRPRLVAPSRSQANESEVPVQMREWIRPALASPDLVLAA